MANPGVGSKFVSVNLNKSYGQPSSSSANAGRNRPAHHGGGNSGMVILSRQRSSISGSTKAGPRLSVPPPLNLPSRRKEHERFDQSSALGASAGGRNAGSGSGHAASSVGWTRTGLSATLLEKDGSGNHPTIGQPGNDIQRGSSPRDGGSRGSGSIYMPPAARSGTVGQQQVAALTRDVLPLEKAIVLRGEDFPTLHATLPSASISTQKQKDVLNQKQKLGEILEEHSISSDSRSPLHMRPQMRSSRLIVGSSNENGIQSHVSESLSAKEQSRKLDKYLPGPLPHVRLRHTSDWEDDERDTGHGLPNRDRDQGLTRNEAIRETEFDIPRGGMPQRVVHDLSDGRGIRDSESGKVSSTEALRGDPYRRDVTTPNRDGRDGSSWRVLPPLLKDGFSGRGIGIDRNGMGARPSSPNKEIGKDSKYCESTYRDSGGNAFRSTGNGPQDSRYVRRDSGYGLSGQNGNRVAQASNIRGAEQNPRSRFGDLPNRHRGEIFQSSSTAKATYSLGAKGLPLTDPILNFGRDKRLFLNSGKPYREDAFDTRDPFSGGLIGDAKIFKRKKDVLKQADFHDPARESFEAELERVQKMQEQERQRVAEEQARALELARREEEERQRLAREDEERRRILEEEAREAAWRAEHERLEAVKRAEEQKTAKEEEKMRILLEEERRKEAARQKLLELEARIARRQAEATKDDKFATVVGDERMTGMFKGRDGPRAANFAEWEDSERMVERITSSVSSDSSSLNRSVEMGSRPHSSRDGNSFSLDRGKHSNFFSRDSVENGSSSSFFPQQDLDTGYCSSRRDGLGAGRPYPRKDFYGGPGVMSYRTSTKGGMPEPQMFDDYPHLRGHRWSVGGDGDHYNRNPEVDAEFPDQSMDKFGDIGWGHGPPRGSVNAPYADRLFQNTEVDGFSSFGRSRHSMRQPRVLPPPSLPSVHRSTFRAEPGRPSSSVFLNESSKYMHNTRMNEHILQAGYETSYQDMIEHRGIMAAAERNIICNEHNDEKSPSRCDSQSTLSVSSPPDSPTHLSHDDLDDSGEFTVLAAADDSKQTSLCDSEHVVSASEGITNVMISSLVSTEDEKWAVENNGELQEQEEYDEEEDTYHEEDEVHEGDDENLDAVQAFEDLHSKEQNAAGKIGQLVLGFDEGVEGEMSDGNEFENAPKNGENKSIETQIVSVGIAHDGLDGNAHVLLAENGLSEGSVESSSKMIHETEKLLQDLTLQSPVASPSYLLDSVEEPNSSGMPDQQAIASAANLSVPYQPPVQLVLPAVSPVLSQAEVPPVKLQFGLFSGPSLIPSPVPAIQIGSIQMPLLHPQVGPSLTQLHPSQPPFFQFGQLRYTSPMSQGILPLTPQTLTFAQPAVASHYSLNQNPGGSLLDQEGPVSSTQSPYPNDTMPSVHMDIGPDLVPKMSKSSQESISKEQNSLYLTGSAEGEVLPSQSQADGPLFVENKCVSESVSQVEDQGHHDKTVEKNSRSAAGNRNTQGQQHTESIPSQFFSNERDLGGSKAPGAVPGSKGKRFIYSVRNTGSTSSVPVSEASHVDSSGFQRARRNIRRTEFRVRENVDRRQSESLISSKSNYSRVDEKSNFNGRMLGIPSKGGNKKDTMLNKSTKPLVESETFLTSGSSSSHGDTESKINKALGKVVSSKMLVSAVETSCSGGKSLQNKVVSEEVDAPLQSGVVRVFKQPGIEAPSDEDDFIEVRSKRQMLNDRREQREKEIKAKSRVIKALRKPRSVSQTITSSANSNRSSAPSNEEIASGVHSESLVTDEWASANDEVSTGFAAPPLPPIGTPAMNTDANTERRSLAMKLVNTSSVPVISSGGTNVTPGSPFENKNAILDNVITPFGSWASVCVNQQVMALTQTQLDEAMKPARFDTHVAPIGDHTGSALEPVKPSTSTLTQDKSFSSSASPLSSLLAGEKIQFGAVTSPTILPPSSLAVSSVIGPPGSCRSDVLLDHNISASEGECTIIFDKEKHPDASCVLLADPEAEAEAAASAVAVAAISSDELVGNGLGASSVSVADTKSFGVADISGLPSGCGVVGDQHLPSQSRAEESLTVALPADLSVETPSLSLWPPLPSPHNSSAPMLSHFPGAPPPHFPYYEMNPILGPPIFAFGPHDESAGSQQQSQKSGTTAAGSLGAWQPCHSGVDSFYGPPGGFTGPFISPGGMPGVQGPPHMVVYNHFAPVGQFGQVGLSFMGTAYIPSGKQPDWKHTPVSSAVGISEGDIHNLTISSGLPNPPNISASMQHLAPGSPLLPMASPLAMFDLSPFQSSADISMQARLPHVPASSLHSVLQSMPPLHLQQQAEGGPPSQFSHGLSVGTPNAKSFQESRSSTSADTCRNFSPASGSVAQFPGEGLIEPLSATSSRVQSSRPTSYGSVNGNIKVESIAKSSSRGTASDASQSGILSSSHSMSSSPLMAPVDLPENSSASHYLNPIGYTEQRGGGASQKIGLGGDWHRRVGFQGRNQTLGAEKNFASTKIKQIYVAKPATNVPTTTV